MKRQHLHGLLLCLGVTLTVLLFYFTGVLESLELKSLDARFVMRGNRPSNSNIVVVAVDEPSIAKLGRWPWPRATHAKLIRSLTDAGARVIAFDVLLTEPDKENLASDAALAKAAASSNEVVSAFFFNQVTSDREASNPLFPYSDLADATALGFVNLDPDSDGITRQAPLYLTEPRSDGSGVVYPSLAAAAWAISTQRSQKDALKRLQSPSLFGSDNKMLINFAFDPKSPTGYAYPTYSYVDVLEGTVPASTFKNKMVFVGVTAAGLFDLKAIPYISKHPGVMIHANVLDNLLAGNYLRENSGLSSLVGFLVLGLLLGFLLPRLSPWGKLFASVTVTTGWLALSLCDVRSLPSRVAGCGSAAGGGRMLCGNAVLSLARRRAREAEDQRQL